MATKIIPFDLETAKKIQAGELEGTIKTKNGILCKIVSFCDGSDFFVERKTEEFGLRWCFPYSKFGRCIGKTSNCDAAYDLVLEVPDEPVFKPFDKVLVRDNEKMWWRCTIFSHYNTIHNNSYIYVCSNGAWPYCIPYEGNEHLVGKNDKP